MVRAAATIWEGSAVSGPDDPTLAADQRDVDACLAGDPEAFERLLRRYQGPISRLMWRFARQADDQEELTQEVFINAWGALGSWRREGPLLNWLRRIAVRVGYAYWRRQRRDGERMVFTELIDDVVDQDTLVLDREQRASEEAAAEAAETVHRLLAKLSERDRLVLTLLHLEELSVAEIAAATGWSQSLVKVQAHRARGRLRKLMESEQ